MHITHTHTHTHTQEKQTSFPGRIWFFPYPTLWILDSTHSALPLHEMQHPLELSTVHSMFLPLEAWWPKTAPHLVPPHFLSKIDCVSTRFPMNPFLVMCTFLEGYRWESPWQQLTFLKAANLKVVAQVYDQVPKIAHHNFCNILLFIEPTPIQCSKTTWRHDCW